MPTHPESQRIRSNECNGWSTRGKKAGDRPKNRAKAVEATSSTRAKKPKLLLQVDSTGNALRKQLFNILKIKTLIKASWWCCQMDIQMKRTHTHTHWKTHTLRSYKNHNLLHDGTLRQMISWPIKSTEILQQGPERPKNFCTLLSPQPKCLDRVAVEPQVQHGHGCSRHGDRVAMEP